MEVDDFWFQVSRWRAFLSAFESVSFWGYPCFVFVCGLKGKPQGTPSSSSFLGGASLKTDTPFSCSMRSLAEFLDVAHFLGLGHF